MELPQKFLDEMQELLGEAYPAYLASFEESWNRGLRVNERKLDAGRFCAVSGRELEPVPWISNGFYYDSRWLAAKDPYYYAGLYYLQEPSAMTPASRLPVEPGDRVLDLCAAPGGKATELGVKLRGKGILFANDISNSRAKALLKNLELFGIPNICVTSETPEKLAGELPGFFDKILVDAPCSGEGMFRKEPDMMKDWLERGPEYYAPLQREILTQAAVLLKPGGLLLYSTCTFSRREDEENILWLLAQNPEMELVALPQFPGASDGFGLSGVLRLFPYRLKGEGHFLALLRKKETADAAAVPGHAAGKAVRAGRQELGDFPEFAKGLSGGFAGLLASALKQDRVRLIHENLYLLPEEFPEGARLRYLRTGLHLGELKRGRFEPGQAFAMALKASDFSETIHFSKEDERVLRYLKGETLSLLPEEGGRKGWCLVCLEDFPLGWAKGTGAMLKNKYYPGWRYQ
ncbi:MAG: RsmB/NOP family class I SAM-dependent RNA methyltransferase [Lachnospiraceae bacterium]|nr:RsmB/NOP family class I SAM-dependent RNA methyltransferase [Lachnospiraceae bacterium]